MTWGNLGSRVLGFAILLPLVLAQLSVEEASLWLLFQAILALHGMIDFGFTPTFIRVVSYARSKKNLSTATQNTSNLQNIKNISMHHVIGTMRCVYHRLSIVAFLLMVLLGSWITIKPISLLADSTTGWLSWIAIIVGSTLVFRSGMFGAYLQGANQIALYQRWQIITGMLSLIGATIAILMGGGLLLLVLIMQTGGVMGAFVTRRLAVRHAPKAAWSGTAVKKTEIMQIVWPSAWRSGLGVAMTYGTIQGTGIVYTQIAPAADAAAFLLAQRIMQTISSFANAPFYTRIPKMSRMYAEGRQSTLIETAKYGMLQANWVLVAGIVVIGFAAEPILTLIGSQTPFVSANVWWLLGLATLVERIGAMHLQLYSITNHIVWHIVASITAGIMLVSIPISFYWLDIVGLPFGILVAYAMFFTPYTISRSYSAFHMHPVYMDGAASLAPMILLIFIMTL